MRESVHPMSDATADVLFGGSRLDDALDSSFFHEKLLATHFDPSLVRMAGIKALLEEQEAEVKAFDAAVAESDALVCAAIATISDHSLFVLDAEVTV
jgi:hypothetical protein